VLPEGTPAHAPQYGGELNIATVYVTLSAMSWDPADWAWKHNHDAGQVRETLMAADLSKARSRGGEHAFFLDAWIPEDALRGELAESWYWEDPLTLVIKLRRGVYWPAKAGFMSRREMDASDVVWSFNYSNGSPRKIAGYFDFVRSVEARDSHTVVFRFVKYNAEWPSRLGYGYYMSILPRESEGADLKDWKSVTGTGPFRMGRYLQGSVQSFDRNPDYWDTETISGRSFPIPFVDRVTYRIIKDEASFITAVRTGKIDILETTRWSMAQHLRESTPELQWTRWLAPQGYVVALRNDRPPLDDKRVRRALNMAVNKQEMVDLANEGHAEVMAFPQHPAFGDFYQPLEEMPESVRELFTYDPEKARALLREAGLEDGFELSLQVCSCNAGNMDSAALIADYWERIGVRTTIETLEYAAFVSAMSTRTHASAYLYDTGHGGPVMTLRKNYMSGQLWNASMYENPDFDRKLEAMMQIRDEASLVREVRALTVEILDEAPGVILPTPYLFSAWWPWVKNYGGELRAGAVRPGPIYARAWIDHDLKKRMGFE
jgi:peptide/nickel transport system substrate-binding protein